jgi:hypothetical protein
MAWGVHIGMGVGCPDFVLCGLQVAVACSLCLFLCFLAVRNG